MNKLLRLCLPLFFLSAAWSIPGSALLPPRDGTVVVTSQGSLLLKWDPGLRIEWWQQGRVQQLFTVGGQVTVSVTPGQTYAWRAYSGNRLVDSATFEVSDQFEYRSPGRDGEAGVRTQSPQDGKAGSDGGNLRVDLSREGDNLNLEIQEQGRVHHYLLADPGRKFLISVRGGSGGKGSDGLDYQGPGQAQAGNGGASGWGGHIDVTVHQIPWREALELDVSPGTPGAGGRGGTEEGTSMEGRPMSTKYPDGKPGAWGQAGTVTTHIQP